MPDFLAVELHRQRLDQVEQAAEDGARRREWLRASIDARRTGRGGGGR